MSIKFILFLVLVAILFGRVELFYNFGRQHYEKHFCEIIQEELSFTDISIFSSSGLFPAERFVQFK